MTEEFTKSKGLVYTPPPKKHTVEVGNLYCFTAIKIFWRRSEKGEPIGDIKFRPREPFLILEVNKEHRVAKIIYLSEMLWIKIDGMEVYFLDIEQIK